MSTERRRHRLVSISVSIVVVALCIAVGFWRASTYLRRPAGEGTADLCRSDADCASQFTCRVRKLQGGRTGLACRVRGSGREGERCRSPAMEIHEGCLESLRCNYGFCGRPCEPDAPNACPAGMQCRDSGEGSSCVPTCKPGGCPPPTGCAAVDGDFAICAIPIGERCDLHPCKPGTVCLARYHQERTAVVESRCVVSCAASKPCPAGQFCDDGECATPCHLDASECPPGMFCSAALSKGTLARCWPE